MLTKKVKLSSCYLRNRGLELNPKNQKQTTLYKNVFESIKEKGLINPLTVVVDGDRYKVCIGNNRYLACKELGIEEVNIVEILPPTAQKGDTTIFNPDAFKVNPDATAEELGGTEYIRGMPYDASNGLMSSGDITMRG